MDGIICNTGHSVMFYLDNGTKNHINITGGPLSYKYQVYEIHIHYGQQDDMGSEHSINGYSFPAEVIITYRYLYFGVPLTSVVTRVLTLELFISCIHFSSAKLKLAVFKSLISEG